MRSAARLLSAPGRLSALTAALIVPSACGPDDPADEWSLDRFTPLEAVREARIGDAEDPDIGFSRIGAVDLGPDGDVYVFEASAREIRVYGPDGRLIRRLGGSGQGPGEFEGFVRFGVVGDTVWAFDPASQRITLFRRDGTLISAARTDGVRVPLPEAFGWLFPRWMRPDGMFVSHFSRISSSRDSPPSGVEPHDSIPVPFVLFDANGRVADTIGWAPRPPPRMWRPPGQYDIEYRSVDIGGRRFSVPQPPTAMPWWEARPDGYILVEAPVAETAEEGGISVTRFGLDGDPVYSRTVRYRPRPYTERSLDSIAVRAARGEPGGMVSYVPGRPPPDDWRVIANRLREEMDFPSFQTPIQYPWSAQDGSVWLRRWDGTTADAEWFVLDPSGRPKGALTLPSTTRPFWSVGDQVWAAEYDELAVPWLVRLRIRPREGP